MCADKKLVIAAWEIGHPDSGCGVKVGGMGAVLQELPLEMWRFAASTGLNLEIEVLSPCFRFYNSEKFRQEAKVWVPHFQIYFDVFSYCFQEYGNPRVKHLYFWNEAVLGDFGDACYVQSVYPGNARDGMRVYSRVSAAMATYLEHTRYDALHLHDYHLGLISFYLEWDANSRLPLVFTIHNASYQGCLEVQDDPQPLMHELGMPGEWYSRYFESRHNFNALKGIVLKIAEMNGSISTVSAGYAAELALTDEDIRQKAISEGLPYPKKVIIPSGGLAELGRVGIAGINNGLSEENRPENSKFFKAADLGVVQENLSTPLFRHPVVHKEMLAQDHTYSFSDLQNRNLLKQFLFLECFQGLPADDDIAFCAVGRMVPQKNFEVLLRCMDSIIGRYPNVYFAILVNPLQNTYGQSLHEQFIRLADQHDNVYYSSQFSEYLSKFILAGSNYCLIPSRFEPCGIVDYEAALLGTIPIVRKTGGLVKTLPHAFAYYWYDEGNLEGESVQLIRVIEQAIEEYINYPSLYQRRIQKCMEIDTSWQSAVKKYFRLLRLL